MHYMHTQIVPVYYFNLNIYYMGESVLLGTKPLEDFIRHSMAYFPYVILASVVPFIDVTIKRKPCMISRFFEGILRS